MERIEHKISRAIATAGFLTLMWGSTEGNLGWREHIAELQKPAPSQALIDSANRRKDFGTGLMAAGVVSCLAGALAAKKTERE
jgi:hypothetical protein